MVAEKTARHDAAGHRMINPVGSDHNPFQFVALTISDEELWGEDEVLVIDGGARTSGDR